MNKKELKIKMDLLEIDSCTYSFEGELLADSIILYNSYDKWKDVGEFGYLKNLISRANISVTS